MNHPRAQPVDVAVSGMLKTIGYDRVSFGCAKHEIATWITQSSPTATINRMLFKGMCRAYKEQMERIEKGGNPEEDMKKYLNR